MSDVLTYLANTLRARRLPHAVMFLGQSSQKAQLAILLARGLCCPHQTLEAPFGCGSCTACDQINKDKSPNLRWILALDGSAETHIGIDEIRLVNRENSMKGVNEGPRIFIFPFGQQITQAAANAFLKTLEEPGPNSYIFMLAPSKHAVLPTLSSRCQRVFCPAGQFIPTQYESEINLPSFFTSEAKDIISSLKRASQDNAYARIEIISKLATSRDDALKQLDIFIMDLKNSLKEALINNNEKLSKEYIFTLEASLLTYTKIKAFSNPILGLEALLLPRNIGL